jgi:hypothetical protein
MNCGPPDQLPPGSAPSCFLNLNWDQSMAADQLDPALSSMVSSPASNSTAAAAVTDGRALHGISPQQQYGGTPLSSPPKLNLFHQTRPQFHHFPPPQVGGLPILENLMPMGHLDQFLADPGFAERAARLSGFDGRPGGSGYGGVGVPGQFGIPDAGPIGALKELELGNGRDESSVSDPASGSAEMALNKGPSDGNAKKRKASGKGKGKDGPGSAAAGAAKVRAHTIALLWFPRFPTRFRFGAKGFIPGAFLPFYRRSRVGSGADRRTRAVARRTTTPPPRARPRRAVARMVVAGSSRGRRARRSPPPRRPRTTSMSGRGAARRRTATASRRGYVSPESDALLHCSSLPSSSFISSLAAEIRVLSFFFSLASCGHQFR